LSVANITYRQVNYFELCFENYVLKYALKHTSAFFSILLLFLQVSKDEREKDCNKLCPLECESTQYKISHSMFTLADIGDGQYGSKWIPFIREKINKTINSTNELHQIYLKISLFFDSLNCSFYVLNFHFT